MTTAVLHGCMEQDTTRGVNRDRHHRQRHRSEASYDTVGTETTQHTTNAKTKFPTARWDGQWNDPRRAADNKPIDLDDYGGPPPPISCIVAGRPKLLGNDCELSSSRTVNSDRTTEAPYTSTERSSGPRVSFPSDERTDRNRHSDVGTTWYDTMNRMQENEFERTRRQSFSDQSVATFATFATTENPKVLISAYRDQKQQKLQKQAMVDTLSGQLEHVQSQVGEYHELLEKYEQAKGQNMEMKVELENLKQEFSNEKKELEEDLRHWKKEAKRLQRGEEQKKWEYEDDMKELKEELFASQKELKRLQRANEKNEKLQKEIIDLKMKLERGGEVQTSSKSLEEEVVSLKLELAKAQEREDWHAKQLQDMASQYSQLSNEQEQLKRQQLEDNDERTDDRRRQLLGGFAGDSIRSLSKKWGKAGAPIDGNDGNVKPKFGWRRRNTEDPSTLGRAKSRKGLLRESIEECEGSEEDEDDKSKLSEGGTGSVGGDGVEGDASKQ